MIVKEVIDIWEEKGDGEGRCHIVGRGEEGEEEEIVVDAVVITTGRSPHKERFPCLSAISHPTPSLSSFPSPTPLYIPDHVNVPRETFDSLPLSCTVHTLGCSLSAFDVVNALFSPSSSCEFVRDEETKKLKFLPGENQRKFDFLFSFLFFWVNQ